MKFNVAALLKSYQVRLVIMMVGVFALFTVLKPGMFLQFSTFSSMSVQLPEYGVMALGVTLAFISGCIDVSFMYLANLCAIIAVIIMRNVTKGSIPADQTGLYVFLGIAGAMVTGVIAGIFNGTLIAKVNIPPILATLATGQIFSGISKVLTLGRAINGVPEMFADAGMYKVFGFVPVPLIIFLLLFLMVVFLLKRTVYGSNLYLLGSNRTAARFSGMKVTRRIITTFALCGALSAIAGLLMTVSYNSAKPDYGSSYLMQCILIAVLGGISPNGGYGKIGGVLLAIITVQIISTGFNMFSGISNYLRSLLTGVLLVGMMIINYMGQNGQKIFRWRKRRRFTRPARSSLPER
jgi:simple sugar transport system permease protein